MIDPMAEVVGLLQPRASRTKSVTAAGAWRLRRDDAGAPFYAVVLEGSCRLAIDGLPPMDLQAGDFVLCPAWPGFTISSLPTAGTPDTTVTVPRIVEDRLHVGRQDLPPDTRYLVGACEFDASDAHLLTPLLPQVVLVRNDPRLSALVQLAIEESRAQRPAREVVLARLLEVLMIEALRTTTAGTHTAPGLARALADPRLAQALRSLHARPGHPWTVAQLADEAALSRSTFFERFQRALGATPMDYLLAWRMAIAKRLLRQREGNIAEVAERVGYSSASTFSVAFNRHVGLPPGQYARAAAGA